MPTKIPRWFTYFDDITAPFPCWKIKIDDDIQTPVAVVPAKQDGPSRARTQARLIVRLVNQHLHGIEKRRNSKRMWKKIRATDKSKK